MRAVNKIVMTPIDAILFKPKFTAKEITKGAIIEPVCESASIDPAPTDWIYSGKDYVWIITIMK